MDTPGREASVLGCFGWNCRASGLEWPPTVEWELVTMPSGGARSRGHSAAPALPEQKKRLHGTSTELPLALPEQNKRLHLTGTQPPPALTRQKRLHRNQQASQSLMFLRFQPGRGSPVREEPEVERGPAGICFGHLGYRLVSWAVVGTQ